MTQADTLRIRVATITSCPKTETDYLDGPVADINGRRHVGWVDINILASAVVGGFQVWTADSCFSAIASELRVAYTPAPL